MHPHILSYADPNITAEEANRRLPRDKVVVGWYSNRKVRQSVTHYHPYHEYIYMISGRAYYHVDGARYELHPGEMMLIPPGVVHTGYYDTYDRLIIQIDDAFWQDTVERLGQLASRCELPGRLMIFHAEVTQRWQVRPLIEHAAAAASIPDEEDRALMYRSLLVGLGLVIRQAVRENGLGQPAATSALVASVTAYIHQHYRDPDLNVTKLAQYAYVSREHLSRIFKEYTMQSVHNYLTELRMQSCRQAIADGQRILDACTANGFSDYSSFLKTFHKLYGITPMEYRARIRAALREQDDAV